MTDVNSKERRRSLVGRTAMGACLGGDWDCCALVWDWGYEVAFALLVDWCRVCTIDRIWRFTS